MATWKLGLLLGTTAWIVGCAGLFGTQEDGSPGLFADHDADDDGFLWADDCDDTDPAVNPGATEMCDPADVDEDCNGVADNADDGVADGIMAWHDADADGFGDPSDSVQLCEASGVYVTDATDCDDGNAAVNPLATEVCDAAATDEDCDGLADDADDSVADSGRMDVWADADGDGYGDEADPLRACAVGAGQAAQVGDCDDADATVNPAAYEVCGGGDEDCDGAVDTNAIDSTTWYADGDGDAYGDPYATTESCDAPAGYGLDATDCDDEDDTISPDGTEQCNGADDDCDGSIDEDEAVDVATWYRDSDGDGYGDPSLTEADCDEPSGYADNATDCDDTSASISPGDTEVCDTSDTDEDCDGLADDADSSASSAGKSAYFVDSDGDGYGAGAASLRCDPASGFASNVTDCDDTSASIHPGGTEVCDSGSADEDCDLLVDDRDSSVSAATRTTWYVDADGDSYGVATLTRSQCDLPSGYSATDDDCDDAASAVNPGETEVCDDTDVDEDCDSGADDLDPDMASTDKIAWSLDADADNWGTGGVALYSCATPAGYAVDGDCDDTEASIYPGALDSCLDDVDSDCDGGTTCSSFAADDARLIIEGPAASASVGMWVATTGDMDGDGVDDVVGLRDTYRAYAGEVQVVSGGDAGTTAWTDYLLRTEGVDSYDYLGRGMSRMPDIDGDGEDDFVVGATSAGTGNDGAVYVLASSTALGTTGYADDVATTTVYGANSSAGLAYNLVAGLDWDGDGDGEVFAIGDGTRVSGDTPEIGYVLDVEGTGTTYADTDSIFTITDPDGGRLLQWGCTGDVTGDGMADIFVRYYLEGRSYDYSSLAMYESTGVAGGAVAMSAYDAIWTGRGMSSSYSTDAFGTACAADGDFDGDGLNDLVAGAWYDVTAYVFEDTATGGAYTDAVLTITGHEYTGWATAYLPDVGGDGRDEVAVGAPSSSTYAGQVAVYAGGATGSVTDTDADALLIGRSVADYFGRALAGADLDHDGRGDLVVGAYGDDEGGAGAGAIFVFDGLDLLEP
ncbi:MAG: MopE-related protein [Pseudomonadota bacterium]|nr:MopE-related protein [Pseudomonadota bacterium]